MKYRPFLGSVIVSFLLCATLSASAPNGMLKKRVLADLDCIQSIFDVKYAPKQWKEQFAGWELDRAIADAKSKISSQQAVSLKECQVVLRDFFNSTRDYHVGIRFFSTESSSLPFLVKGAEGRYFVCFVDEKETNHREFPFEEGDELLTFGGKPIHEVIEQLRIREFGANTIETDQALAELSLTHRRGDMGQMIPQGKVEVTGIKKGSTAPIKTTLTWRHNPEKIRDFSKLGIQVEPSILSEAGRNQVHDLNTLISKSHFFEKFMVSHMWDKSYVGGFTEMNRHALGARTSFIPELGQRTWKANKDAIFDAYIFETPSGKRIGYIRLPHYIGDEEEVEEFGLTMNFFEKRTDALVIDQINNPGGSVFYLYALASTLTNKPLHTPKHHIAMTQEEIYVANQMMPYLEQVTNDETARKVLGDSIGGYPVDFQFVRLMKQFCNFLVKQWEEGKMYSDPTFLFGVDDICPHPSYRYTKPILLLINSLDFSGGDFFPAILQDNERALVFGTRTAGAGGYVLTTSYPNHSGIKGFQMTGSLAKRIGQQPIENLGIVPDIQYNLSATDLQEEFREYAEAIVSTVESLAAGR